MYRILSALLLLIIIPYGLKSQILPGDGNILNYRIVGFSVTPVKQATNYKFEIAAGHYDTEDSFQKNVIRSVDSKKPGIIAEVPTFGSQYTWRVVTGSSSGGPAAFHHFSTGYSSIIDTGNVRLRITKPAVAYKDAYIFSDGTGALYDMQGRPVWYMPQVKGLDNSNNFPIQDMHLSPRGTITFLLGENAYEINYDGIILWKGPNTGKISGDKIEHYHHDFSRLHNGHYMVLGSEAVFWSLKQPLPGETRLPMRPADLNRDSMQKYSKMGYAVMSFGTVIEYDAKGKVVWSWKSSKYFSQSDLRYYKPPEGRPSIDVHANALFFDEKQKAVYISFRDINRIVKVKYPEGNVIKSYGEIYQPGIPETGTGLFFGQHSCRVSEDGHLYLFNNNAWNQTWKQVKGVPKITVMQEPVSENGPLEKIWEYDCSLADTFAPLINTGGNVVELPGHCFFVCMGKQYSTSFIVDRDKKILWSANIEKRNHDSGNWEGIFQYRAGIITTDKELEQLVWSSRLKK